MSTDLITAARAMIEPLTEYTSAPWAQVSAGDNGYHIGSGGWTVDASDPDGGYFGDWHICLTTGCYLAAEADARLIAAAPDLRDMVAFLADALEAERARAEKAEAERDQALARLAAVHLEAIERCAALLIELGYVSESGETLANEVRGLRVDPDAQDAHDKLLAEARLEGWRAGRDAAAEIVDGTAKYNMSDPDDIEVARFIAAKIRARPEPKEASHDD